MGNLEANLVLLMFGLFLMGLWLEAKHVLRLLVTEDKQDEPVEVWEADYQVAVARLEARQRLVQMRRQAAREARRCAVLEQLGWRENDDPLRMTEFRLLKGGARTPLTRERSQGL